jgi:arginine deiminase
VAEPAHVDSEVGRLRTVLLHRPGHELTRLTPRNNDQLLFDGIPWVARAQAEHDSFAAALSSRGVEVLLLGDLLVQALAAAPVARTRAVEEVLDERRLGPPLAALLGEHLVGLAYAELAEVLMAGLTFAELPGGSTPGSLAASLVRTMHAPADFVLDPLPNLLFTRDSSVWLADRVAITSLALPARRRETALTDLIYAHHPRFAGTPRAYAAHSAPVEGGDVLLLAPGVLAVGVGERTTPAGAESLARSALADGLAHTVLVVPIAQSRATMHLDTVCTMVDRDAVVMYPTLADTLRAYTVRPAGNGAGGGRPGGGSAGGSRGDVPLGIEVTGPAPFRAAAAEAMGIGELRVIDTGLDPVTAEREQWDDGNNTLALAPGLVVAYERNTETNARLEDAGIEVVRIAGSELGSGRGGPRCMSCPVCRDPLD